MTGRNNKQHTRRHQAHLQVSTSTNDSKTNAHSSEVSTRTQNKRSSSHPKSTHSRDDTTTVTSNHTAKSREYYSKEPNAQPQPSAFCDIAFDLRGLTLNSQSSNSLMTPASVQYFESHEDKDEFYSERDYLQSNYLSSDDQSYTYPSSITLTSKKNLNPMERYLEEGVAERCSIFSTKYEEPSSDTYGNNDSGNGGGSVTKELYTGSTHE